MINLRNSPFLWFALLLLLAYGLAEIPGADALFHGSILLWVVCFSCSIFGIWKYNPGQQFRSTLAIGTLLVAAGLIRMTHFHSELYPEKAFLSSVRMEGTIQVIQLLKTKEGSVSIHCQPIFLHAVSAEDSISYSDKFLLLQIKEIEATSLFPGDRIKVEGWISAIKGPMNPHAFDIRTYYNSIGIRHQMFCKGKEITLLSNPENSISRITAKWQFTLSAIVKSHTSPQVAQLTNALVWGDRSDMDEEVRDAFSDSGAMHVLSVSGMHVAIIYSMLYFFLGAPGVGTFTRRMIRLGFYIMAIMLYMGLSGACPAVVRAGLMIILFLIGKAMGWNTQIWNLLGFAAFVMLWINPYSWQNTGFQLSFLAMAGILLYAQPMIRTLSFKNKLFHLIWEITAVSMAAQVFILPLLLKQFHQFPITFVASSLVAMPASYVIIFGSILNVILSLFHVGFLWPLFDKAGYYFILSMKWMASANPAMNFSLPVLGTILLLAMAIMYSIALIYNWKKGIQIAYLLGGLAFLNLLTHRIKEWRTDDLVIYNQYQGLLMDVITDGHCISIQDSTLTAASIEFATRGNRCYRDVIHTESIFKEAEYTSPSWTYHDFILHHASSKILVWHDQDSHHLDPPGLTHILVNDCSDKNKLHDFLCAHSDCKVILTGHLDRFIKNGLLKFLDENDIDFYDISQQGYFKLNL